MLRQVSRSWRRILGIVGRCCIILAILAIFIAILTPSYTHFPAHYRELRRTALGSATPGRANLGGERIFVAASLYDPDGSLMSGDWARSVLELIDLLGPDNTFLSVYSSDSGPRGSQAMAEFETRLACQHRLLSHEHVPLDNPAILTLPDGELGVKRIKYLATARNIALEPLEDGGRYDRILFLNDVYFDPIEAAQLLFLTNSRHNQPHYQAACAADFDNPWKYYDTFATRDAEGYSIGVPLFPWFTNSGTAQSRSDVWRQVDAVRVRSCWGGMAAFNASYFQNSYHLNGEGEKHPVRFRAEQELEWDYSECCLIHADLEAVAGLEGHPPEIYLNPYIRTAYDARSFRWLWIGRRTEKLLGLVQHLISSAAGLPRHNEQRTTRVGELVRRTSWTQDPATGQGLWTSGLVPAHSGLFCRVPGSMVRRLTPTDGHHRIEQLVNAADFARCIVHDV